MTEKQQHQSLIANAIKDLIAYGKADDYMTKTVIINTYDETDKLESTSAACGNPNILGHMALSTLQTLPEEVIIHIIAHLIEDYPDTVEDLLELYHDGGFEDDEE